MWLMMDLFLSNLRNRLEQRRDKKLTLAEQARKFDKL